MNGSHKKIAIGASVLFHGSLIATIILTANLGPARPPPPPKAIDIVSIEELLPPLEKPPEKPPELPKAEAPPLVSAPVPQAKAPAAEPSAQPPPAATSAPAAAEPPQGLGDEVAPATPDGGGMMAPTGTGTAAPTQAAPGRAAVGTAATGSAPAGTAAEPDYLAQFKITEIPVIPVKDVLSKIVYPPLAAKQGIQSTVFLELFIDETGKVRKITVLKDPGNGFAEAAIAALGDIVCGPAKIDGHPVAVRYRYPVRFTLK